MASVWAARVRGRSEVVALKTLLPELAENVEFRKMFFDEARIASRARHPNVCSTFEMGEHEGTLYLAMEFLDGPSLMRVLRPGKDSPSSCDRVPIPPRIAARILADACAGLHAAHELVDDGGHPLAVVHRDVSPHNLLMTCAGDVKITDFGVAKALGKSHMTVAGQLKGKLAYMAPEQLMGGAIDRRCDVFALGCVLYEITTGQRPFQGEHDPQVMAAIVMGRFEPPAAIAPEYPHQLSIIVMRALASEPENRYASADEMRQALEAYLRASGPPVGPVQLAAFVRERCGTELEARAAALRGNLRAGGDASAASQTAARAKSASESGSGAILIGGPPAQARRSLLWMTAAALVGAGLGIGVLGYVRMTRKASHPPIAAASENVAPMSSPAAADASTGADAGEGAAGAAGAAAAATDGTNQAPAESPPARVHLTISPSGAAVIVDGVELPPGTDTVARPRDGETINVVVRADKHQDTIVLVDSATPDDVEVTLMPQIARRSSQSSRPSASASGSASASASAGGSGPGIGDGVIDAPPNPYD